MRVLITGRTEVTDGVSTYIEDLRNAFRDNGHYVYHPVNDKDTSTEDFDIIFTKGHGNYKCPAIIHEHGAIVSPIKYDMYRAWVKRKGCIVTVNSEYQKEQLVDAGVDGSRIKWLPNCIDEKVFTPRDIPIMHKHIIYLGRAGQSNKNTFLTLIEVMKIFSDYSLNVVGNVDGYIERELIKHDLPNVSFIGAVHDKNILAEIISMHSFGIGVGRSAMEMLLCGLPVMIFGQGWEGWVNERNVESLHRRANMTSRLSKEVSMKEKISRVCSAIYNMVPISREKAVEVFGLRKNLHIYESLFKGLIDEGI